MVFATVFDKDYLKMKKKKLFSPLHKKANF